MNRSTLAILAALLLHLLFFGSARLAVRLAELIPPQKAPPPSLFVEFDAPLPQEKPRRFLWARPDSKADPTEPPPEEARYFSDRNQRVARETVAPRRSFEDLSRLQSQSLKRRISEGQGETNAPLSSATRPDLQDLVDEEAAQGAETLLSTARSVHYSFFSRMYEALAPVWRSRISSSRPREILHPGDYTVVATLVLDAEGNVLGVEFHERSPVSNFNDAVVESAQKVARFPNPPQLLIDERNQVRTQWSFTVSVGENSMLQFEPPRRIR